MLLRDMTWEEAEEVLKNNVVVIPTGSTEQHGPQNPLGTDHLIAEKLSQELDAVVIPTIPIGISKHHRFFSGTLWVSYESFKSYLMDICMALKHHGVRKILFVNGHGGNTACLMDIALEMKDEDVFVRIYEWWRSLPSEAVKKIYPENSIKYLGHAASAETSLNMFLHPELVKIERAKDVDTVWAPKKFGGTVMYETKEFTDCGVVGFSKDASPEKGKIIFEASLEELKKLVEYIKEMKL
ncbi:MAG TPA: creatininase family protein [Methanomicrobia archaeon]|nr:creatininase family protein [Methanomicrobia archaeon]